MECPDGEEQILPAAERPSGVQVSCRLRGHLSSERTTDQVDAVRVDPASPSSGVTVAASSHAFGFDHVFGSCATQRDVFSAVGAPCVRDFLLGYNCTLLAYGQTGSGKTHTTMGDARSSENAGLLPRMLELLFDSLRSEIDNDEVALTVSFIEVYQERLRDLLISSARGAAAAPPLRIREEREERRQGGGVWVERATEITLLDLATARTVLQRGLTHRSVGATALNDGSSRSHAVFAITMTSQTAAKRMRARLCVVDLAGSEQAKKTRVSGARLDEAKHINRSLSALGNVIHALTAPPLTVDAATRPPTHVPYRDSKLTRLLQSSLGGNAKTHLLLTCATASCHVDESLSTLRFGARAKQMKNKPTLNAATARPHAGAELLETLQRKIESLCRYIRELEANAGSCQCALKAIVGVRADRPAQVNEEADDRDPAEEAEESIETKESAPTVPTSNDVLVEAEVTALRRALREMQRLQAEKEAALALRRSVDYVQDRELEQLHERQAQQLQQLEVELADARSEIYSLQYHLRQRTDDQAELMRKLELLGSIQRREDEASNAETEILRRRLDHNEKILQSLQLELSASQNEASELRQRVKLHEHELSALRAKTDSSPDHRLPSRDVPSPSAAARASPPRSKPALRPVTVAAGALGARAGANSMAIHSWWAGESPSPNNVSSSDNDFLQRVESSPLERGKLSMGRDRLSQRRGWLNSAVDTDASESSERNLHAHTSVPGARPFRARLVGLLNSLEAETTSYKELLTGASDNASSDRQRPSAPSSRGRTHQLPELTPICAEEEREK